MKKQDYIAEIPYRIQGIPCLIGVIHFYYQKPFRGSPHHCDSDWDYYGYTEVEYDILDRKGYYAKWLLNKLTPSDKENIEGEIKKYYTSSDY